VMPADSSLGKFSADFAGRLGMIEEYPNVPKTILGFGGSTKIIDSDELLHLMLELILPIALFFSQRRRHVLPDENAHLVRPVASP